MDPGLVNACGVKPGWPCDAVYHATGNATLAKFCGWLVGTPLKVLLIALGAVIINHLVGRSINRLVGALVSRESDVPHLGEVGVRTAARARTLGVVLRSTATVVVYGLAAINILGEIGLNLGPLIAGAGIAGVALGFGAQSLVKDFLTGTFMLVEDQYGVGDVVDLGLASGTVEAVSLRTTLAAARPTGRCGTSPTARSCASATRASSGRARCSTSRSPTTATSARPSG